jgi:hypothetical protein
MRGIFLVASTEVFFNRWERLLLCRFSAAGDEN